MNASAMVARLIQCAVGLIIAGYWARVLRLAWKVSRRWGKSPHLIPPGRLGFVTRLIWFPTVMAWIVIPLATPLLAHPPVVLRPVAQNLVLECSGLVTAMIAFVLTLKCWKSMGKDWRMGTDADERTVLVTTGAFARVRHPIYALSAVMMLSTVVVVPSPIMICAAICHLILLRTEAATEEAQLAKIHGRKYLEYCEGIPRFLPTFAPPGQRGS